MLKLLGCICVLSAGVLVRYRMSVESRRVLATLGDMAAALEFMRDEIRLNRTAMPLLLLKAGTGRGMDAMGFFAAVRGESGKRGLAEAWRNAAEALPLPEREVGFLVEAGACLLGDEERACRGLSGAAELLRRELERRNSGAAEASRRSTALCLSASALIVILLV